VGVTTLGGTAIFHGFIFGIATAVGNLNGSSTELKVYPNPAKDYLIIEHPAANKPAYIKCIDAFGRMVEIVSVKRDDTKTQVNIGSLSAGVYQIIWSDGKTLLTKTALIIR